MMISEKMGPKTRSKTTKAKKKPEVVEPLTDEEEDDDFADDLEEESKFDFIKILNQAGAELGQAQVKLEVIYEVIVKVGSCKCS